MNVSGVNGSQNTFPTLDTNTKKPESQRTAMQKDDFLKLLVTSLQYQDPMSPMENSEMMQQMAMLGLMEQTTNMSRSVDKMVDGLYSSQIEQGSALLGKKITAKTANGEVVGNVDFVQINDGTVQLLIDDKSVKLGEITKVSLPDQN